MERGGHVEATGAGSGPSDLAWWQYRPRPSVGANSACSGHASTFGGVRVPSTYRRQASARLQQESEDSTRRCSVNQPNLSSASVGLSSPWSRFAVAVGLAGDGEEVPQRKTCSPLLTPLVPLCAVSLLCLVIVAIVVMLRFGHKALRFSLGGDRVSIASVGSDWAPPRCCHCDAGRPRLLETNYTFWLWSPVGDCNASCPRGAGAITFDPPLGCTQIEALAAVSANGDASSDLISSCRIACANIYALAYRLRARDASSAPAPSESVKSSEDHLQFEHSRSKPPAPDAATSLLDGFAIHASSSGNETPASATAGTDPAGTAAQGPTRRGGRGVAVAVEHLVSLALASPQGFATPMADGGAQDAGAAAVGSILNGGGDGGIDPTTGLGTSMQATQELQSLGVEAPLFGPVPLAPAASSALQGQVVPPGSAAAADLAALAGAANVGGGRGPSGADRPSAAPIGKFERNVPGLGARGVFQVSNDASSPGATRVVPETPGQAAAVAEAQAQAQAQAQAPAQAGGSAQANVPPNANALAFQSEAAKLAALSAALRSELNTISARRARGPVHVKESVDAPVAVPNTVAVIPASGMATTIGQSTSSRLPGSVDPGMLAVPPGIAPGVTGIG